MIPTPEQPLDLAAIRLAWPGATDLGDEQLTQLVRAAMVQCDRWAADATDADAIDRTGPNYLSAVAWQARENNNAGSRDGDTVNIDGYSVRVRPLIDAVKMQLRPPRAVPAVG
jgi:hypothetical protein